jgi:phosphohistidine phosphatase SixA
MRLLLVRHARAGDRGHGPSDLERPLDERGVAQAAALPQLLGPLLDAAGGTAVDVHSSPALRCVQTVAPLGAALGVDVVLDDALLEGCDIRVLRERIATLARPSVWSSHGDVIPGLLMLLAHRGLDLGDDPRCRKGSTWAIDVEDGEPVRARYLPPPC